MSMHNAQLVNKKKQKDSMTWEWLQQWQIENRIRSDAEIVKCKNLQKTKLENIISKMELVKLKNKTKKWMLFIKTRWLEAVILP